MGREAHKVIQEANDERERERELLRPIADFFHEHEGKLFERYEAIDDISDSDIDAEDEGLINRVIGNLCSDRVDPVQNVVKDESKYVGVIEYEAHDYWYEYVEWDDVEGRFNVGVCAQCVKEAERDTEVAKGTGDTEDLASRIEQHYGEEHDVDIEEVDTGATLSSGTTVAGNTVFHSGNDGQGSGLDADLFRGSDATPLDYGTVLTGKDAEPSQYLQFLVRDSPYTGVRGADVGPADCIWTVSGNGVTRSTDNFNSTELFSAPSQYPRGLALDSGGSVWVGDSNQSVYRHDQGGTIEAQFAAPNSGTSGLVFDSSDSLWITDNGVDSTYETDTSLNVLNSYSSPSDGITDLTIGSNDSLWFFDDTHGGGDTPSQPEYYITDRTLTTQSTISVQSDGVNEPSLVEAVVLHRDAAIHEFNNYEVAPDCIWTLAVQSCFLPQ